MPNKSNLQPQVNNSSGPLTSSSGNELIPVIRTDDSKVLISGFLIHERLQLKTKYSTWAQRKISDLMLKENIHFFISKRRNLGNDYLFPIRIAEAIVLMQGNEISLNLWQQLVNQETSLIFNDGNVFSNLSSKSYKEKKMYQYTDVLRRLEYTRGGSNYKVQQKWVDDFAILDGSLWVSERYASVMSHRRMAKRIIVDMKRDIQLKLQFEPVAIAEKEVSHE